METLLLCEELFLLTHDDESGKADATLAVDSGYAGALLLDLAACGAVQADGKDLVAAPHSAAVDHPLLMAALEQIRSSEQSRTAKHWVTKLPGALKPLSQQVGQSLADRGILEERRRKIMGLFPTTEWPETNPHPERELRARLDGVLAQGASPDLHTAALISLLGPLGKVERLVEKPDRKTAKQRAKAIAESDLGGGETSKAVKDAVAAIQAAILIAVIIPAATVTS